MNWYKKSQGSEFSIWLAEGIGNITENYSKDVIKIKGFDGDLHVGDLFSEMINYLVESVNLHPEKLDYFKKIGIASCLSEILYDLNFWENLLIKNPYYMPQVPLSSFHTTEYQDMFKRVWIKVLSDDPSFYDDCKIITPNLSQLPEILEAKEIGEEKKVKKSQSLMENMKETEEISRNELV